ncbi:hypothetical protein VMCG_05473 [Cytospora schulzeri]|uniref:Uncharacterized protein n=1 Tax=Cytospora schulzeri TaxID=448051 RepID=A0A423WK81_9PEZI|nr:hypothetical protein VMCG_05473 [Valsa malicola]
MVAVSSGEQLHNPQRGSERLLELLGIIPPVVLDTRLDLIQRLLPVTHRDLRVHARVLAYVPPAVVVRPLEARLGGGLHEAAQVGAREAAAARVEGDVPEAAVDDAPVLPGGGDGVPVDGAQDVDPLVGRGEADEDAGAQAAGPADGRVDAVGPVGGADDVDAGAVADAVELGEEGVDDAGRGVGEGVVALGHEGVHLVEEEDARRAALGPREELPHRPLRLAHVLVEQLGPLDGDEVGLGLVGHGLGHERLSATGGSPQEDSGGRLDAHPREPLRVLDGADDGHLELLAHLGERAHVLPRRVGHRAEPFPLGGRLHRRHGRREVGVRDAHGPDVDVPRGLHEPDGAPARRRGRRRGPLVRGRLQVLRRGPALEVHLCPLVGPGADRLGHGGRDDVLEVGADVAGRELGQGGEVDVVGEGEVARHGPQDLLPGRLVGHADVDLDAEAAAHHGVDAVGPVGGGQHDDVGLVVVHGAPAVGRARVPPAPDPVHAAADLGDDAALHGLARAVPLARDRVELVEEDEARRQPHGLVEDVAYVLLALAARAAHQARRRHGDEGHLEVGGQRVREHRLAAARGPVEQHPVVEPVARLGQVLGLQERDAHRVDEALDHGVDAGQVVEVDVLRRRPVDLLGVLAPPLRPGLPVWLPVHGGRGG